MPLLSIKTNKLDFQILESSDPKTIIVLDKSIYLDTYPEKPLLEVLLPGYSKSILVPFKAFDYNVINSSQLNISCGDNTNLPDGVYCITLRICPHDSVFLTKIFLKTDLIDYKFSNFLLSILEKRDFSNEEKRIIENYYIILESAKSHASFGNTKEASLLYKKAEKILNKLNCN